MAISNSASGFRPGVCTSTTRPTSPFNGQVIYETDTKQTLVWQGSVWVMLTDADTPPGLQLVKTQTVGSGVGSIVVNDAFSSEFENYRITYTGGTASNNTTDISLQLNGATGSDYDVMMVYAGWGASASSFAGSTSTSFAWAGGGQTTGATVMVDLLKPFLTQYTIISSQFWASGVGWAQGRHRLSTSYTGFTLISSSPQTLTGGTIRVYGYRNTI